ncbi:MAG: DUF2062 domain-containing protein [Candidatus Polarisedimenticolia bacterium]
MNPPEKRPGLLKRARHMLLEQHASPARLGLAVGIGVFVGLTPFYMLHALIAGGIAWALRLNIAAAALASQISNPFFAPGLIAASLWIGNAMGAGNSAHGAWDPSGLVFYVSWLRGGAVLGVVMGTALGLLTFAIARISRRRFRHA